VSDTPLLIGDVRRLKQVLINLVKNSIKFITDDQFGLIEIVARYERDREMLRVDVKDNGRGISPDDIDSLFKRFGKLQRTAEMNNEGVGLGLTIVKQIVESCNGKVSVRSPGVGKGTTMSFSMQMKSFQGNLEDYNLLLQP